MRLLAFVSLACSSGDETKQANEHIAKANKQIETANDAGKKGLTRISEMESMTANIKNDSDLEKARAVARECKDTFMKARDAYKEASEGFTAASKLKIRAKFKEYTEAKASELKERGDMMAAGIDKAQALIDSESRRDYQEKLKTIVKRFTDHKEKADELSKKADKIQEDNREVFKEL